ncbi:MAG TPA: carboxypeptidase-like regulatory domain-containing protein [Terriglobia bacterium]|jgi:hypothetical protein|nr:carboxypeptidase-like regulatory domain-containing protein [Terriglobia bacterium]
MFVELWTNRLRLLCLVALLTISSNAAASEYHGTVTFGGLPLPGATITLMQGGKSFSTVSDQRGVYSFPDLPDGTWTIEVQMTGFAPLKQDVAIEPGTPPAVWDLKLLPLAQIKAQIASPVPAAPSSPSEAHATEPEPQTQQATGQGAASSQEDLAQLASAGLLINGSLSNGAATPFALPPAFGNNRYGGNGLYRFGLGAVLDNSSLDASPFSLTGQRTPKPVYNRITGLGTFGGPLKIPHLVQNGPYVFAAYQWTRTVNATTSSALVPDAAERSGDLSQSAGPLGQTTPIFDPATGSPFEGNVIPSGRISPQAQALLNLYPLPNLTGSAPYNYQVPLVTDIHQSALQSRFDQTAGKTNEVYGGFAFESSHTAAPNVFGFLDSTDLLGISTNVTWWRRLSQQLFMNLGFQFTRLGTQVKPYFQNRQNVSGEAGISGNDQDPRDWGPPALTFASGIAGLSDSNASFNRNQTSAISDSILWSHGAQNVTFGGDFRREEFNYLSQQNPRGVFTFTGAATAGSDGATASGSAFADFLLGIPDTSALAFGNADKYFRESVYDAFVNDDYRLRPNFTLNAGIRWEYGAPITELFDRLVNLDISPGFAAAAPVLGSDPVGPLTGQAYPNSLIRPDRSGFEPRVGIAWRPIGGSSLVVRAGYGVNYDTSVYQTIALQMAQQAPLSKSVNLQNSPACPLTLAKAFGSCPAVTADTFGIDPNFRVGYAQNWDLAIQRDLPGSLQLTATYLGTEGTRGLQEFLPNTYPLGAQNLCQGCPVGFAFFASNGNSTRQAGQIQLRRRLASGFTGTLQYTYSKAIDDDSQLGGQGPVSTGSATTLPWQGSGLASSSQTSQGPTNIAQNWLDLSAERSLSSFDQRNLLAVQLQYTTGMGLAGETLLSGKKGAIFKEWTLLSQITYGSGLPETPVYLAAVSGTGFTGTIRPDYTGAPLYSAPAGLSVNPAAYAPPAAGQWGDAGRFSIIGPDAFSLNASIGRTFRLHGRFNLDLRFDSTNVLNHPTFTSWITTINSAQFGLPAAVNPMRSVQTTLRLRF